MTKPTLEERRNWVISLMIECPMGESLDGCPAKDVRGRPLGNIVELVGGMREDELNEIIAYHRDCLRKREEPIGSAQG